MPDGAFVLVGWGALLALLVVAAILIGRLTARFFLRAAGGRAGER